MANRRVILALVSFMLSISCVPAQPELDSLFQQLDHSQADEQGILEAYDAVYAIELDQPQKAYRLYQALAALSQEMGYDLGAGKGVSYLGEIHFTAGEWELARQKFREAMGLVDTSKEVRFKAIMYNNIGNSYNIEGDFISALGALQKANLGFEAAQDTVSLVICSSNITAILNRSGNYEAAIRIFSESLPLALELGDPGFIGDHYLNVATSYQYLHQYDSAISYFREAYHRYLAAQQTPQTLNAASNLAQTFFLLDQTDSAQKYLSLGNALVDLQKYPRESTMMYIQQSIGYIQQGSHTAAERKAQKAMELAEVLQDPILEQNALDAMVKALEGQQDYQRAGPLYKRLFVLQDSLSVAEKNKQLLTLRTQFETEQKEKEIALLQKQKALDELALARQRGLSIASFGSLGIVLLVAFFLTRNYRQAKRIADQEKQIEAQKVKELEEKQKLVALNATFKGQEEERIRIAKDLHDGLGGALAAVKMRLDSWETQPEPKPFLHATTEMVDNAYGEVRRIAHNMSPYTLNQLGLEKALGRMCEQVSTSGNLDVDFQALRLDLDLPPLKEVMVYRIVQELINNTLKHADASELVVQLAQDPGMLHITVEDDGKGFDPTVVSNGMGMQSIRSRVESLEGALSIDSSLGKGTSILINLPL